MHMKLPDAIGPLIVKCRPPEVGCDDDDDDDDDEVE